MSGKESGKIDQKRVMESMISYAFACLKSWESLHNGGRSGSQTEVLQSAKEQLLWIMSDEDEYGTFRQACLWQDDADHQIVRRRLLSNIDPVALNELFIETYEELDKLVVEAMRKVKEQSQKVRRNTRDRKRRKRKRRGS